MKNRSYLGESKTHYKMYKRGKNWVTLGVTFLSVGLGAELGSSVSADNVNVKSTPNSQSSTISSQKVSSQSKVVKLKSSSASAKTAIASSDSQTSTSSIETKDSTTSFNSQARSTKVSVASSIKSSVSSPEARVQPTNFAVTPSAQSSSQQVYAERYDTNSNAIGAQGTFEGTKGTSTSWTQALKDFNSQYYQMMIYMLNANGNPNSGHDQIITWNPDIVRWNPKTGEAYYGAFGNHPHTQWLGVEYNAGKDGLVTVHAPVGWKFDTEYTNWYDPKRNGTGSNQYFVSETPDEITFSFQKALNAKVTLGKGNGTVNDCLNLFLVKDGEQSPEIPSVPKDTYQNVLNIVASNGGEKDDGAPVAQYVMNFHYGNNDPRTIHANNPDATTFVVYAPKGYQFKGYSNEYNVEGTGILRLDPNNDHIGFYTTYDCPYLYGGHYSKYYDDSNPDQTHFYTDKIWVTPDKDWQGAPSYAKDGWMIKSDWDAIQAGKSKPSTNTTPSKPATNNKPAASATPSKPATNNKPAASVTPSKPATNNKPAASVTPSKPATNNKPAASATPSKPATNSKPAASVTPNKPATNNKPAASVTPNKPATNNKPAASVTPSKHGAAEGTVSSKRVAKKTTSKTNRVIGTVNADQIKKSKSSEMRSAVNKSASLPVTGESSNSLKEIGLVMSSAVLGLLGLLGFTSEKKH